MNIFKGLAASADLVPISEKPEGRPATLVSRGEPIALAGQRNPAPAGGVVATAAPNGGCYAPQCRPDLPMSGCIILPPIGRPRSTRSCRYAIAGLATAQYTPGRHVIVMGVPSGKGRR